MHVEMLLVCMKLTYAQDEATCLKLTYAQDEATLVSHVCDVVGRCGVAFLACYFCAFHLRSA